MRKMRITPLNITAALLMTGMLWLVITDGADFSTIGWFLLFLLVIVLADQFFRLLLRRLKQIWIAESIFVGIVGLVIWTIRVW